MYFILLFAGLVFLFGFVVLFGAPYVPTFSRQANAALDLLNLKEGSILVELGSGDGAVLLAAARRGIRGIGYELNPLLVVISRLRCWRYRHIVQIHCRNFWHSQLPSCDGVYVFLLDRFMTRLDEKITREAKLPVKLVSYAFQVPGRKPVHKKSGMFLYTYPAAVPKTSATQGE